MSLGKNTDILTEALRDAEDALDALQLGVSAKAPLGPEHFLSWEKNGADWGLVVHSSNADRPSILAVSRRLRIMAADSLPALHSALLSEYARQDREVIEATDRVRGFTENLRAGEKGSVAR